MPVAETVMGDITGYIQTNLMSMTDGHIFFDIELFNQGKRPAVNPFLSVTRVGHQTQTSLLRDLSRKLSGFLVEVTKLKDLLHFGGELTDRVRKGLIKGSMIDAIFSQGDSLVVPLPISALLVGLVFADMGGDSPETIAVIRSQLMMAYSGDLGWKEYIDKLMVLATFDELVAKLAQDRQLLTPLLTVKRG
jgi:F-type H+-transporting ATPase subunit alpha